MTIRQRVYRLLRSNHGGSRAGRAVNLFILGLIALNVAGIALESVHAVREGWGGAFYAFEVFSVAVFTVEYVLRLWTCVEDPRYARPVVGRLRAAAAPMQIIDLLAILPFYLPYVSADLLFLRSLRLFRVFRAAKVARYSVALQTVGRVIRGRRDELAVAGFAMALVLILASMSMYYAENDAQPRAFASVPDAMWWAVATMTTVGYGDVYPITPVGKLLGSLVAFAGIGMFALPTAILGAGFLEELQRRHARATRCPHCGKEISPSDLR